MRSGRMHLSVALRPRREMDHRYSLGALGLLLLVALVGEARGKAPNRGGGERFALLIAVRQYAPSELRSLKFTEADVEHLADVLAGAGYLRENIRLMTQTRGAEQTRFLPTSANIRTELSLLLKNMDEDDRVVVALAGHGVQLSGGEESYFCPADARLDDPATLIALSRVYEALESCTAGVKVLLVDACRNDPLTERARAVGRPVVDLPSLTRPLKRRTLGGIAALFSCSSGERAYEDPELKHGVFFHFVIKGLGGEADFDGDGKVDLDELAAYTKKRVYRYVEVAYRVEQTPEQVGKGNLLELATLRLPVPTPLPVRPVPGPGAPPQVPQTAMRSATPLVTPSLPAPPPARATLTNTLGMVLVPIPAGSFLMGAADDDDDADLGEKPQHRVRITRPFYLGATEVTLGQFRRFVKATGYTTLAERDGRGGLGWNAATGKFEGPDPRYNWRSVGYDRPESSPVVNLSWNDAIAFCNRLSELEGLAPYYRFGAGERSIGSGYRLPTEAEWEYAARAGSMSRYLGSDDPEALATIANVADASLRAVAPVPEADPTLSASDGFPFTAPVGRYRANDWGLFDIQGNVWEMCGDWYDAGYFAKAPEADPRGPAQPPREGLRVFRGGSFYSGRHHARITSRFRNRPSESFDDVGFRVARSVENR